MASGTLSVFKVKCNWQYTSVTRPSFLRGSGPRDYQTPSRGGPTGVHGQWLRSFVVELYMQRT